MRLLIDLLISQLLIIVCNPTQQSDRKHEQSCLQAGYAPASILPHQIFYACFL